VKEIHVARVTDEKIDEIIARAKGFKGYVGHKRDDYRDPEAGYYGGFQLLDNELSSRLRSAGKEILKTVGK